MIDRSIEIDSKMVEKRTRLRGMAGSVIPVAIMAIVLFGASGVLEWVMAWLLLGIHLVGGLFVVLAASPSLIEERTRKREGAKGWDKVLLPLMSITGFIAMIMAGLDMRYGWSGQVPLPLQVFALVLLILGYALLDWAAISNKFFSTTVRIQEDRGHTTITGGPYRFIRHPGYCGLIICILAQPLMLGSLWAIIPAAITVIILLMRTGFEDRILRDELAGYVDYTQDVRYRLLPRVW
jgi:protein-S-isoprenylcysteine O-methyltransferase Ste14